MTIAMPSQGLSDSGPASLTDRDDEIGIVEAPVDVSRWSFYGIRESLPSAARKTRQPAAYIEVSPDGASVPSWLAASLPGIGRLMTLPADWDHQGAPAIQRPAIKMALNALIEFMDETSSAPQWTPTPQGGVQLDWHERGVDLEIEFDINTSQGYAIFSDHTNDALDWDGTVVDNLCSLRTLFMDRLNARAQG